MKIPADARAIVTVNGDPWPNEQIELESVLSDRGPYETTVDLKHYIVRTRDTRLPDQCSIVIEHDGTVAILPDVRKVMAYDEQTEELTEQWHTYPGEASFDWLDEKTNGFFAGCHIGMCRREQT